MATVRLLFQDLSDTVCTTEKAWSEAPCRVRVEKTIYIALHYGSYRYGTFQRATGKNINKIYIDVV